MSEARVILSESMYPYFYLGRRLFKFFEMKVGGHCLLVNRLMDPSNSKIRKDVEDRVEDHRPTQCLEFRE